MIRAGGGDDHYQPSLQGQVLTGEDRTDKGGATHIKSERLRRPQKNASIGFSKAETLTTSVTSEEKAPTKNTEKGLSKLLSKKKKVKEADVPEEMIPEPQSEKKFIRDPFAPVRLSDDLRNFKPKKPSKYDTDTKTEVPVQKDRKASASTTPNTPKNDLAAAKTLLQEYVQNNLRTANVLLKYTAEPLGNGTFKGIATLDGKVIGISEDPSAKKAERTAAHAAYVALTDSKSAEHKWFFSLSEKDVTPSDKSWDHVSRINQYFQQKMHLSCAPITYEKRPTDKKGTFCSVAIYEGKEIGRGVADNIKDAKQLAAKEACKKLGIK
jgi:dsRNA-specific ribonuclease